MKIFVEACERQYRHTFTMLRQAVELCPEELWAEREEGEPPVWQQVYHTLIITDGYAGESFGDFPTEAVSVLEPREPEPGEPPWRPLVERVEALMHADHVPAAVVTRERMLEYLGRVEERCHEALARDAGLDPADPATNPFPWTGSTAFDKHIYNLRHLHHHLGRVNGLLRRRAGVGNPWVAESFEPPASP